MSSDQSNPEKAFEELVKAICKNCVDQDITGREQIQNIIDQYKQRLTVDLIQGEMCTSCPPSKRSRCGWDNSDNSPRRVHYCSIEGCTNEVLRGQKCHLHGDVAEKSRCSHEGCIDVERAGGLCFRHGGRLTQGTSTGYAKGYCFHEGCTNVAQKHGVCFRHGAKKKLCTFVDVESRHQCTNQAQNKGRCKRHGAKVKLCSQEGCTKQVERGGFCVRHGAERGIQHRARNKNVKEKSEDRPRKRCDNPKSTVEAGSVGDNPKSSVEAGNNHEKEEEENEDGAHIREEKDNIHEEALYN